MQCACILKPRWHNTSYCVIQVATKTGFTVYFTAFIWSSECNNITWIPQTWTQANSSCMNSQQNLRILKDLDTFNNLTMAINITGDVILWIGGKERRKFFIWNNGNNMQTNKQTKNNTHSEKFQTKLESKAKSAPLAYTWSGLAHTLCSGVNKRLIRDNRWGNQE